MDNKAFEAMRRREVNEACSHFSIPSTWIGEDIYGDIAEKLITCHRECPHEQVWVIWKLIGYSGKPNDTGPAEVQERAELARLLDKYGVPDGFKVQAPDFTVEYVRNFAQQCEAESINHEGTVKQALKHLSQTVEDFTTFHLEDKLGNSNDKDA